MQGLDPRCSFLLTISSTSCLSADLINRQTVFLFECFLFPNCLLWPGLAWPCFLSFLVALFRLATSAHPHQALKGTLVTETAWPIEIDASLVVPVTRAARSFACASSIRVRARVGEQEKSKVTDAGLTQAAKIDQD